MSLCAMFIEFLPKVPYNLHVMDGIKTADDNTPIQTGRGNVPCGMADGSVIACSIFCKKKEQNWIKQKKSQRKIY